MHTSFGGAVRAGVRGEVVVEGVVLLHQHHDVAGSVWSAPGRRRARWEPRAGGGAPRACGASLRADLVDPDHRHRDAMTAAADLDRVGVDGAAMELARRRWRPGGRRTSCAPPSRRPTRGTGCRSGGSAGSGCRPARRTGSAAAGWTDRQPVGPAMPVELHDVGHRRADREHGRALRHVRADPGAHLAAARHAARAGQERGALGRLRDRRSRPRTAPGAPRARLPGRHRPARAAAAPGAAPAAARA